MRIIIPRERAELLEKFSQYLYCPKGKHGFFLRDDAPDDAKKAYEDYLNLPPEPDPDPRYI